MPADRRLAVAALAVATAVVAAGGIVAAAKPGSPPGRPASATFEIKGSVDGLLPTLVTDLDLQVENPHAFAIQVVDVTIAVDDPAGACSRADLDIGPAPVPFEVPAAGERTVTVRAALASDAHNACQGTSWRLRFTGAAERAR